MALVDEFGICEYNRYCEINKGGVGIVFLMDLEMYNSQKKDSKVAWWQPAIEMFTRLSSWIVAPVIVALLVGKWLDEKYNIAPWGVLSAVGLAFLVSMFGLVHESVRVMQKFSETEKKESKKQDEQSDC
jgi:F0F1-type ATP synthase assembly protein I